MGEHIVGMGNGEPQAGHIGTAGSHHPQAWPWPCVQCCSEQGVAVARRPGRAWWVPSTSFREFFLKKLTFCCKIKLLVQCWAALWSRAPS